MKTKYGFIYECCFVGFSFNGTATSKFANDFNLLLIIAGHSYFDITITYIYLGISVSIKKTKRFML